MMRPAPAAVGDGRTLGQNDGERFSYSSLRQDAASFNATLRAAPFKLWLCADSSSTCALLARCE